MAAGDQNGSKSELRLLDPKRTHVRKDSHGRLQLEIGIEERHGPVRALRCLPLTQPSRYISIQDDEGTEIGIVADLEALEPESRKAILEELDFYYLMPRVLRIHKVENKNGIITWDLETDLGPRKVHVRDRQNIRPLGNGRTILTDIHNAKFEVPAADDLDPKSRQWLEIEL